MVNLGVGFKQIDVLPYPIFSRFYEAVFNPGKIASMREALACYCNQQTM